MVCKRVAYYQFRNIEQAALELDRGVNVLYGKNAQGKTNALEGIYLMAQGRSFRMGGESDLIRFGQRQSAVRIWFETDGGEMSLEMRYLQGGRRQCTVNDVPQKRLSEFIGHFRAVIFCPQHLSLVREGPSVRRAFADMALSQLSTAYLRDLQEYARILQQRNALIKNCREVNTAFAQSMEPWSVQLAQRAESISAKREEYLVRLGEYVRQIFSDMTDGCEVPDIRYTERKTAQEYEKLLCSNLEREVRQQTTLYGTHRDDYEIRLNGLSARQFSSQGQQRSLALAMKLAEGEISRDSTGEYPVFLLDDIFSELDAQQRAYIMDGLHDRQVVITSCERHPASSYYHVEDGHFTKVNGEGEVPSA